MGNCIFFLLKWFPVIYWFWTLNPNEAELKLIQFSIPIIYFGVRIISELRAFDYIYYYFLFFALVEFKFLGIVGIIGFVFLILNLIWGAVRFVRCDFEYFFFFHIFPGSEFLNSINPMCVWTFMNQNWLLYLVTRQEFMFDFAFIFFFGVNFQMFESAIGQCQ